MKTEIINQLKEKADNICRDVYHTLKNATKDKPLILFTEDHIMELSDNGELFDLPYGFFVDKYSCYVEGRVMEVKGENVKLYLTGESDYGNIYETYLYEIPIDSQIELLSYLK